MYRTRSNPLCCHLANTCPGPTYPLRSVYSSRPDSRQFHVTYVLRVTCYVLRITAIRLVRAPTKNNKLNWNGSCAASAERGDSISWVLDVLDVLWHALLKITAPNYRIGQPGNSGSSVSSVSLKQTRIAAQNTLKFGRCTAKINPFRTLRQFQAQTFFSPWEPETRKSFGKKRFSLLQQI